MERYHLEDILSFVTNQSSSNSGQNGRNNIYNINYINHIEINNTPTRNNENPPPSPSIRQRPSFDTNQPSQRETSTTNQPNLSVRGRRIEPIVATVNLADLGTNTINQITTGIERYLNTIYNDIQNEISEELDEEETDNSVPLNILNEHSTLMVSSNNETENSCSICNQNILPNEILRKINTCNHYFHQNCIDTWLSSNSTCPICRINLLTNEYTSNEED